MSSFTEISPPTIWMYWTNPPGRAGRPPYLEACLESVRRNSGCRVILCDEKSARSMIEDLPSCFEALTPCHQADVFRLHVLTMFGGMYMDFDTIVLRSLVPLFDKLAGYELIGANRRPRRLREDRWEPLATSVMGPMRPKLPFMCEALNQQAKMLATNRATLSGGDRYGYGELLQCLISCFQAQPPEAWLNDGADTWFAFCGGPGLPMGNLGHALRPIKDIGAIPDCEFFALTNVLIPDEYKWAPLVDLLKTETVLAHLLRRALGDSPAQLNGNAAADAIRDRQAPTRRWTAGKSAFSIFRGARGKPPLPDRVVPNSNEGIQELFDREWYLARYPDIRAAGIDPLEHYLQFGAAEERDPNPLFDCKWYMAQRQDLSNARLGSVAHYLREGAAVALDPSPLFDSNWYLNQNTDVQKSAMNPLVHYLKHGAAEGRLPTEFEESGDKILSLYRQYPALRSAECTDPKISSRLFCLRHIPKGGVGAELGVFTGRFAYHIAKIVRPSMLYLVDPWWKEYGDSYPDWGDYTAYGELSTRVAYEATLARRSHTGKCDVIVERSFDWLDTLDENLLDFVYLDSTHGYEDTLRELTLIAKKIKPDGVILGDDWIPTPDHMHYGVFKAVHHFISITEFKLVFAGMADQWMLKRI